MAKRKGKLILGTREATFVKRRLLWLPRQPLVYEADFGPLHQTLAADVNRGRPKEVRLRDNPGWEELFPHLKQLQIKVVVTESLPTWDATVESFIRYLERWKARQGEDQSLSEAEFGQRDDLFGLRMAAHFYPAQRRPREQQENP